MEIKKEDLDDFLNNEAERLNEIDNFLKKPNYLEILGVGHKELQHSNFLAWMLKSEETHGLGDYFLRNFITHIFETMKSFSSYPAVATLPIMNINDTSVKECEDYFEAFKMKFEAFENKSLDKWADEIRARMLIK